VNKRKWMDLMNQHVKDKRSQPKGIPDLCSHTFSGESGIHRILAANLEYLLHLL